MSCPLRCARTCAITWDARAREMMQATLCRRSRPCWRSLSTASAGQWRSMPPISALTAPARPQSRTPRRCLVPSVAVRCASACRVPGGWLAIAEGIETALAVATACALPAWAALSAGGIRALVLPREATHLLICAGHDASGTGQRAARGAAQRWLASGRHVRIALPPEPGTDMADALISDAKAETVAARRVA
jgi:Toprim domain